MIGSIKDITLNGKTYSIKKCGVSFAMEAQGVFMKILLNAGISKDADTDSSDFLFMLQTGLNEDVIKRIKKIVINGVSAPRITEESYEEQFTIQSVSELFLAIYLYNVEDGLKKKEP